MAASELKIFGEADYGFEALDKAELLQPDVIVLDLSMPRLNGLDTASRLCDVVPMQT
jgi:chemotaxis response regulator CheB